MDITDTIFAIRQMQEEYRNKGKKLYFAFGRVMVHNIQPDIHHKLF